MELLRVWNPEKESIVKDLWGTDASAREIGIQVQMSRCAVIGKAHRLGLEPKKINPQRNAERAKEAQRRSVAVRREKALAKKLLQPPKPPEPPREGPVAGGVSIMDLEEKHCRALIGYGGDQLPRYCGATKMYQLDLYGRYKTTPAGDTLYKGSWCPDHSSQYTRPHDRRR